MVLSLSNPHFKGFTYPFYKNDFFFFFAHYADTVLNIVLSYMYYIGESFLNLEYIP